MKNVTITLPEDLARQARIEAARQDKACRDSSPICWPIGSGVRTDWPKSRDS
jgi:hypothetical protein